MLFLDLKESTRRLVRSPAYAVVCILTLTLGAGSTAAMYSVMDALLFRPPSGLSQPDELVRVRFRFGTAGALTIVDRTDYRTFIALKDSGVFAGVGAFATASVSIGTGREAELVQATLVSDEFFEVVRSAPRAGALSPSAVENGWNGVVISSAFWRRRFGEDPRAIGSRLLVDGRSYVITGITAPSFHPVSARPVELWLPLVHGEAARVFRPDWRTSSSARLGVVARLATAASVATAEMRASAILQPLAASGDDDRPNGATLTSIVPGRGGQRSRESTVSLWLAGLSIFVLLVACANLSNLVLTKALAQRREYMIRLALGASVAALMRRALLDCALITLPGGLGALALSFLGRNAVAGFLGADIPLARQMWDGRSALIAAASVAVACLLVMGGSLWQLRRSLGARNVQRDLSSRDLGRRSRQWLLAVQSGLCLALIVVAGLFASSLHQVETLDLGVDLDRTLQLTLNLPTGHENPDDARLLYDRALDLFASTGAVERAAIAERSPFLSGRGTGPRRGGPAGARDSTGAGLIAYLGAVGPGFFSTVGPSALRGRDFTPADDPGNPPVVVINSVLARRLWPEKDPIGECLWLDDEPRCYRVVGVVGGVWKFSILRRDELAVYLPIAQTAGALPGNLYLRPHGTASSFLTQARTLAQSLGPDLPAVRVVSLRDVVDPEFRPWQLGATTFGLFAMMAALIAAIGLYGVVAVTTQLRMREIGIRLALGARRRHVMRVVLGEGLAAIGAGVVLGAVIVASASRGLSAVLYGVSPADPTVLALSALTLLVLTAVAIVAPTLRALKTDPLTVLRPD